MKIKVIVDDKIPFIKGGLEPYCDVTYLPGDAISHADVKNAEALIIRTRTQCGPQLLRDSQVRFIATATIGYDHIDQDYCRKHHISWVSAPGCNSGSVTQYIVSALLNLAHKHDINLTGKTLGVVGVGNVGSKVVKAAAALGMRILVNDPPRQREEKLPEFVGLDYILHKVDFITLHVPLTTAGKDRTWHLADQKFFRRMRSDAFIINSSRGEVVDNEALKNALRKKQIKGAVLDVWENEPEFDRELLDAVDFGTPHIAGYSADGKANGTTMAVQALSRYFGLPLYNWQVDSVPSPENTEIAIPKDLNTPQNRLRFAVNQSYDIGCDDRQLRAAPQTFEQLRGDYYLRREFPAFAVKNAGDLTEPLATLGFKTI